MNRMANPGRDVDVAKIAAVRAAWIRAAEASDITGLIALATDDIVVVHGNGKVAIGIDALRADLMHDFEYSTLNHETHPLRSSFMTSGQLSSAKWTKC